MKVAVMGAGAVGGYVGGLLAKAGNPVAMIARGRHLEVMRQHGLKVRSHWGDFQVEVQATSNTHQVGPVDLVLHTVKTYQNSQAIPSLAPLIGDQTCVIPLQNGVDSYQQIATAVGMERVLPGALYIEATVTAPGEVSQYGDVVRLVFGEPSGPPTPRCQSILQVFRHANINAQVSQDMACELWTKFLFIATLAGVTAAARARISSIIDYDPVADMLLRTLKEVEAVGRAQGVALAADAVPRTMDYLVGWARDLKASMHTDLELERPLELEALTGVVVRLGRQVGVPTPINDVLYSLLLPYRDGSR